MLTILSVAYPFAPVGRDAVGGAEQVLSHLDGALVDAGHRSIVVACDGSQTRGELVSAPRVCGELSPSARALAHARYREIVADAVNKFSPDVVHLHGIDFDAYLPPYGVPTLVTLHLPPSWYDNAALRPSRANTFLHTVSESQARQMPPNVKVLAPIPNGVPVLELQTRVSRRDFAVALGRVCPEKNFHASIKAAKMADTSLLIGGEVFPYVEHEAYFQNEMTPRLDSRRRFLGPLSFARKRRLLSAAKCLLSASIAPETSSLVAMEALACGTPVVAFPSGALPEIIEDGVTGFLVEDEREMALAMACVGELSRETCREIARERFSLAAMSARYFAVYEQLANIGARA